MMTRWQFETGLRALLVLDMQELVDAGAIADRDYAAWDAFHANRVEWFLTHPGRRTRSSAPCGGIARPLPRLRPKHPQTTSSS